MRNDVLCTVNEKWNIQPKIRRKRAKWISHILRRDWLLIEGKMEVMGKAEDISNYCMTLRKRENTRNRKRKH